MLKLLKSQDVPGGVFSEWTGVVDVGTERPEIPRPPLERGYQRASISVACSAPHLGRGGEKKANIAVSVLDTLIQHTIG